MKDQSGATSRNVSLILVQDLDLESHNKRRLLMMLYGRIESIGVDINVFKI